jgi:Lon protease-like protein
MSARLRLFPLNTVLFPGAALNLHVFEERYKQMIGECLQSGDAFGVALIADGAEVGDPHVTPHDVGSTARIVDVQRLAFGRYYISTVGVKRFRILEVLSREPYLVVEAELLEDPMEDEIIVDHAQGARSLFAQYVRLVVEFTGQAMAIELPEDPQQASFIIADALQVSQAVKQRLLEIATARKRLQAEEDVLERLLPQLRRLLERRRKELEARLDRGEDLSHRTGQEKYFGKYFSPN